MARLNSSDIFLWVFLTESVCRAQKFPSFLGVEEELLVYGGVGKGLLVHVEFSTAEALKAFGLCEGVLQICIPKLAFFFLHDIQNQFMLVRHDELRVLFRVQRSVPVAFLTGGR